MQIELYHLVAIVSSRIRNIEGDTEVCLPLLLNTEVVILKRGVRQSKPKSIQRTGTHFHIVVGHRRLFVVIDGQLSDIGRYGHWQTTSRVVVAKEHIGNSGSSLLSWVIGCQQGISKLCCPALVHRTTFNIDDN